MRRKLLPVGLGLLLIALLGVAWAGGSVFDWPASAPVLSDAAPPAELSGALSKVAVTDAIKAGGWPDALLAHALCITWYESSWVTTAHDVNDPGLGSYGLFQIEAWWASSAVAASFGPRFDLTRAFEPVYNATFAYRIYESEGWHVWGTAHFCVGT